MLIEFVNHASLILTHECVRLLCDPWLAGTAFNEGWALLSASAFTPADFKGVTHIWYSHEHPDHFSPRVLAEIPEAARPRIEVLFHESDDEKVLRHCQALGFGTRELPAGQRVALGPDFHVRCQRWDHSDDSWLLVEAGGRRLLNLNDCLVSTPDDMRRLGEAVGPIDVLATQFSIAAWDGNPEEEARRRAGARHMLERTVAQCRTLEPRFVIPFASFVWFCHEENDYMNSAVVRVDEVEAAIRRETSTTPVVLYPRDRWQVGEPHDNAEALGHWADDYRSLPARERIATRSTPFETLQELAERFRGRLAGKLSPLRLRVRLARLNARYQRRRRPGPSGWLRAGAALLALRARPARLYLTDLSRSATFDLHRGLAASDLPREACDLELASDSLAYAFRFLWGGLALQINGRFRELHREGRLPLFDSLWVADGLNRATGAEARPI